MDSFVGHYEESLPCGGTLKVTTKDWCIEYYFPGPDRRYNGTFLRINGNQIDMYIQAYMRNWADYLLLTGTIPSQGSITKLGKMGMQLRVGGWCEGVCLRDYHMPIRTSERLYEVIGSYRYAKERIMEIRTLLSKK